MLIGLCGPSCSGKGLVAEYLVRELGFSFLNDVSLLISSSSAVKIETDHDERFNFFSPSPSLLSQCWRYDINVVIRNINPCDPALPDLIKRPYFLLVYVDAPIVLRFKRAVECQRYSDSQLELFVHSDDAIKYTPCPNADDCAARKSNSEDVAAEKKLEIERTKETAQVTSLTLSDLERLSRLHVTNTFTTRADLEMALSAIRFTDPELLRPSWDTYFLSLAKLAAERTNCMKRRVGCIIVRNKRIVATGYNGTPSGVKNCFEGGCPRCNGNQSSPGTGLDLCLCLHAEENAIVEAGRERCEGSTLYTNLFPCILCSKKIVQSGVSRVVFDNHYKTDKASDNLLRAGGVLIDKLTWGDHCDVLPRSAIRRNERMVV